MTRLITPDLVRLDLATGPDKESAIQALAAYPRTRLAIGARARERASCFAPEAIAEALDALQHVTNTVFRRQLKDSRRIVIDALEFRRAKDEELRQMAKFLVERVKETGAPQEIGPLNSYARRIVHLAVADDPAVASESIGDAALKTVMWC